VTERVGVRFYKIQECGYYTYRHSTYQFGDISDILDQLQAWVSDKTLSMTCTYELEEGEDVYKTYCFDLKKNYSTGDFVLVTWNELPTNNGRVVTVNGRQPVGDATVQFTNAPDGSIPGYAAYFWFIPEHNAFAVIRFHHTLLIGRSNLERYIREYCAKFTKYVIERRTENGALIEGYSNGRQAIQHLRPSFKSHLYRQRGEIETLRQIHSSIRKVIRKNRLKLPNRLNLDLWQGFLRNLGVNMNHDEAPLDLDIKYEIPFRPTIEDFNSMVAEWETHHDSKWDDIGFVLDGECEVRWLSNSIAKEEYELEVTRANDEVVDTQSLLDSLTMLRTQVLGLIA